MCGIAGFMSIRQLSSRDIESLSRMTDALAHRGPDDSGSWVDHERGIAIGHRRLAIVDLTESGHQPMASKSGRYIIAFNGEIYNHNEIRSEIDCQLSIGGEASRWRGTSDTETLANALDKWGILNTVNRLSGMFAIAIWDRHDKELTLVRDRLGEKPLYFGWQGNTLIFASELKAIAQHESFEGRIDRSVLGLYFRHNYVPAPHCIFEGIRKLEPGMSWTTSRKNVDGLYTRYWSAATVAKQGIENPFRGSFEESVDCLDELLRRSIAQQMVADVPVGAFLSGGIDSSCVVALMQSMSDAPINTFTIGFSEKRYDEASLAAEIAQSLGTCHSELYVDSSDLLGVVPNLSRMYCEPFADSSQIPTFIVSELARRDVTVSLSGDGGDELFGGYTRYDLAERMWRVIRHLPVGLRRKLARVIAKMNLSAIRTIASPLQSIAGLRGRGWQHCR